MNSFLPIHGKKAIEILENAGFSAYAVGGCVRDFLLCREFFDIDIATSATPREILSAFSEYRTIKTGIKHGTVTVIIDSHPIEITTFRIDGEYKDSRHPEEVLFTTDLKKDLERRDFTINAMAYNEKTDFIDLFGGKKDLQNRLIRTVGDGETRFSEDALRILRALRFSSCLSFDIEEKTEKAIFQKKSLLKNIAMERINKEFSLLICGENCYNVLSRFETVFDIFAKGIKIPKEISTLPNKIIPRLCGLFYSLPLEETEKILKNLKYDKKTIFSVLSVLSNKNAPLSSQIQVKKCLANLKEENFRTLIHLRSALETGFDRDGVLSNFEIILSQKPCLYISDLDIKGDDLTALGLEGKKVGESLKIILNEVLEGRLNNEKREIIKYLERNI